MRGKKIKQDFYQLFVDGDTESDLLLETGTTLFMPLFWTSHVYVLGAVATLQG